MKLNLKFGMSMLLIISLFMGIHEVQAQAGDTADADGDRVCDWARNSNEYTTRGIDVNKLRCTADNNFKDICPGTRPNSPGVKHGGIYNGCADYQLETFRNYWSVNLGDFNPKTVKVNWLLDQAQGVDFYQEVKFTKNIGIGGAEGDRPEITNVRFQCDNGKGIILTGKDLGTANAGVIEGNYLRGSPDRVFKRGEKSATMVLKLRQQTEDKVRVKSVTDLDQNTIDEIEFKCEAIISQSVSRDTDGDGDVELVPVYPEEREPFTARVGIDTIAIQPPEQFLERGIDIADAIVGTTNKVLPKLEWAYGFAAQQCKRAIYVVLTGKVLGLFNEGFKTFADFIWEGPDKWKGFSVTTDSFLISGRSMCAYTACSKSWCRLAEWELNQNGKVDPEKITVEKTKPDGTTYKEEGFKSVKFGDKATKIQDSLVLSVGCGCVSGMIQNLYRLRAIAQNWKQCMEVAKVGGVYAGDCERVLQQNICNYVVEQMDQFWGSSIGKKLFGGFWNRITGALGTSGADRTEALRQSNEVQAAQAQADLNSYERTKEDVKDFGVELLQVGSATGRGQMGYQEHIVTRTFCNLAVYGKLPEFVKDAGLNIDKVHMDTTVSGNWRVGIAYQDIEGNPIFGYDISWMVIAGKENSRYNVYLKGIGGGRRPVDRKTGFLRNIGDFDSDYIQVTDKEEYVELCIELPNEPSKGGCYPPGRFATGGLIKDVELLFGEDNFVDSDNDRLPDEWEKKYNCHAGRPQSDFKTPADYEDCQDLIRKGGSNLLDPSNSDTDRDGTRDDKENPDGDGLDNFQELLQGGNPNHALKKADGTFDGSECIASFDSFEFEGVEDVGNGQEWISEGGELGIVLYGESTDDDDVVVKVTIKGENEVQVSQTVLDTIVDDFIVWNVPSDVRTGEYEVKVELVKLKSVVGSEPCTDEEGKISKREDKIIVVNSQQRGCIDTDGGKNVGRSGVCIDSSGPRGDSCNGGVNEYFCGDTGCESEVIACTGGFVCLEGGYCGTTCFDSDFGANDPHFAGVCKDADSPDPKFDSCDEDGKVIEYGCNTEGICEAQDAVQCGSETQTCQEKRLNIPITQLNQALTGDVGMCMDKVATTTEESKEEGIVYSTVITEDGSRIERGPRIFKPEKFDQSFSDEKVEVGVSVTRLNLERPGIWRFIEEKARGEQMDRAMVLALISVESNGILTAKSKANPPALGFMQIVPSEYPSLKIDENLLVSNAEYSIRWGVEILRSKYNQGQNRQEYERLVKKFCKNPEMQEKYLGYIDWDAALRLYNGLGCTCEHCDVDYVEKVNKYKYQWWIEQLHLPS
tara:strand:- start:801 stop:4733 length:3933 start_codon:yes stop_codon:yes gene_type:complete